MFLIPGIFLQLIHKPTAAPNKAHEIPIVCLPTLFVL